MTHIHALERTSDAPVAWCEPQNLDEAMRLAKMVANSAVVPSAFRGKPGDVLVAMQLGAEVGLSPMAALQNVAVINGRPSLWGDAMLAVCRAHSDFEDIKEELSSDGKAAKCTVQRAGQSPTVSTFTMADAETAGLARKKGPWQEYPKRMLQLRARGFALRDAFPDALRGMISAEEARDIPPDLPLDEDGVPTHEIKRTRAEETMDRVRAKQAEKAAAQPAEPEASEAAAKPPVDPIESRNEVLAEIVQICTAKEIAQEEILDVVRSILERDLGSAADMTHEECVEVRRVLREEKEHG